MPLELDYATTEEVLQIDQLTQEEEGLLDHQQLLVRSLDLIVMALDHQMQDQQIMAHVLLVLQDQIIMVQDLLVQQGLMGMEDLQVLQDQAMVLDHLMLQDLVAIAAQQMRQDLQILPALMGIIELHLHLDHQDLALQEVQVHEVARQAEVQVVHVDHLPVVVEVAFNSKH